MTLLSVQKLMHRQRLPSLLGILEGLLVPVAIGSILDCEMVWPLPPRKFGGCKVSVVGVCQLQCLRRLCGICGSLLVSHSWDPGLGRNYRHGMSRMEFQSDG